MPNCLVDNEAIRCKLKEISIGQMQVAFRRQPNLVFEARYEGLWSGRKGKLRSIAGGSFLYRSHQAFLLMKPRQKIILSLNSHCSRMCEDRITFGMFASLNTSTIVYSSVVKLCVAVNLFEIQQPRGGVAPASPAPDHDRLRRRPTCTQVRGKLRRPEIVLSWFSTLPQSMQRWCDRRVNASRRLIL